MGVLRINRTKNSPEVTGDASACKISFVGNSFPENAQKFYMDVITWVESSSFADQRLEIDCDINYMASSSIICFLDFLKKCEDKFGSDNCTINWNYEDDDDDALKIGEDFLKIIDFKINFLPY